MGQLMFYSYFIALFRPRRLIYSILASQKRSSSINNKKNTVASKPQRASPSLNCFRI